MNGHVATSAFRRAARCSAGSGCTAADRMRVAGCWQRSGSCLPGTCICQGLLMRLRDMLRRSRRCCLSSTALSVRRPFSAARLQRGTYTGSKLSVAGNTMQGTWSIICCLLRLVERAFASLPRDGQWHSTRLSSYTTELHQIVSAFPVQILLYKHFHEALAEARSAQGEKRRV